MREYLPEYIRGIISRIRNQGYEAHVAGGACGISCSGVRRKTSTSLRMPGLSRLRKSPEHAAGVPFRSWAGISVRLYW